MAITNGSQQTATEQPANTNAGFKRTGFSFHQERLRAAPIGRSTGSEEYIKLKNALTDVYKKQYDDVSISLIDMDSSIEPDLHYSCILVTMMSKTAPEIGVAYHILLLEATGDKVVSKIETVNNKQIEVPHFSCSAFDDVLFAIANKCMERAFPNIAIYRNGGTVVPRDFDSSNIELVHRLAFNASLACGTSIEMHDKQFKDINLAEMKHDSSLTINVNFTNQTITDCVNAPVRSSAIIGFTSRKNTTAQARSSINNGDNEVVVSNVSGFVDLVWAPVAGATAMNPYIQQQQQATQKYIGRMIVTDIDMQYDCTPGALLLSLATTNALNYQSNWMQAFKPTFTGKNDIDITDVGALNIEANLDPKSPNNRIDTKSENFGLVDLGMYLSAIVRPELWVAVDCPIAGPQTWYTGILADAANGVNEAYQVLYKSADSLTNGRFSKLFQYGNPMFEDIDTFIHNGYWIDKNGNKRDIRDFDYTATCNLLGPSDPDSIKDWSDTFLRKDFDIKVLLDARKKMIMGMSGNTAVFTGISQRVTFTQDFLNALSISIKDTGMTVRVLTPLSSSDFNATRGVGTITERSINAGPGFLTQGGVSARPGQSFGNMNSYF